MVLKGLQCFKEKIREVEEELRDRQRFLKCQELQEALREEFLESQALNQALRKLEENLEDLNELQEAAQALQEELQEPQKPSWCDRIVEHPSGRFWPVLAAVLSVGAGLLTSVWGEMSISFRAAMLSLLLAAVVGIQSYGQEHRDRKRARNRAKTEIGFIDLCSEVEKILSEVSDGRAENKNEFSALANAIGNLASKCGGNKNKENGV